MIARRPYQIGPSSYKMEEGANGWYVVEEWSQADSQGNRDDGWEERISGPHTYAEAQQRLLRRREGKL